MNSKDTLAFLGSLSSKLCHDIVAPVSAIDMGISLLDNYLPDTLKSDPAYGLLKDSLDKTLRRINFFRYAFAFGKNDVIPTRSEFISHCENACSHFKVNFLLEEFTPPSTQQNLFLRIITCILYLLIDTLPKGGTITLSISNKLTSFEAIGTMVVTNTSLEKIAHNARDPFRAQTIIPELVLMGLQELGMRINMQHTPTALTIILQ